MPPRNQPTSPSPPPPASFPFTSGSFDFPHASTSPPPASRLRSSASRVGQLTQFINQRQQEREQRAAAERDDEVAQRQPRSDTLRRRQAGRAILRHAEREPGRSSLLRRATPSSTASRPRATPSERYLRRSHTRLREQRSEIDATDILDSLSDIPFNPFHSSNLSRRERSSPGELDSQRRQSKRRKLDHDVSRACEYDGFKYGYKGQVVSGRLRMDIVSCDGGEYERYNTERLYKVQNVLNNDKSVYCSENSRCNLLLKHIGETPFCLEKVVIRAPDRGFTAPVQEGMIFVSMSQENLLSGTAAYQIEYSSRSPRISPTPSSQDDQLLSLREAMEDPQIWEQSRQGMEDRTERLRLRSRRMQLESSTRPDRNRQREERRSANEEDDVLTEYCPYHIEEGDSNAVGVSAPTPPPFTITTESEHDSDEGEALPSAAVMADRLRRESRWRPESDDEEDGDDLLYRFPPLRRAHALDSLENFGERRWRSSRYIDPIHATSLRTPSRIEPKESDMDPEGLIAPHARFFIARHKNKITIKFHPAISGKCVLLKLWSPTQDGNIDMESVQFYGYSGPRFFPAVEPR